MKNKKFMAMILVLSMMLMGAGYAAWTQSFDVEATVNTGELKLIYIDEDHPRSNWSKSVEEFKYQTATYTVNENTFDYQIDDLYPGIDICVTQQIANVGTIPAVFDSATVVFSDDTDQALLDDMMVNYEFYWIFDEDGNFVEESPWTAPTSLSNFEANINEALEGARLEPGQVLVIGDVLNDHYDMELSNDTTNDTENSSLGFTVTMNFKQFNK